MQKTGDLMTTYSDEAQISVEEYIEFLTRTNLGKQYPKKNFQSRIKTLLESVSIRISARNPTGLLVGVCLGLTDWAYYLTITDLGVARDYERQGIGRQLLTMAHEKAGGPEDIGITLMSHSDALGFYARCGLLPGKHLLAKECTDWESFVVGPECIPLGTND